MKTNRHSLIALASWAAVLAILPSAYAAETQSWPGTLYRNGGHFGDANSDERFESGLAGPAQELQATEAIVSRPPGSAERGGNHMAQRRDAPGKTASLH